MLRNRPLSLLLLSALLLAGTACDNIGRAFDPNVDPGDPGAETGISTIQVVPVGGQVQSGRPVVRAAYPEGSGWPSTVPIVVEFSESINEETVLPSTQTGLDARVGVRLQGTTQFLPAQYDFLAKGRLLVLRPINGLQNNVSAIYEVVLLPEARDVDGVRFQVSGGENILSEFQVNQDESITDGAIVAVYPRDNFSSQAREDEFIVVFDSPANANTLLAADLFLQPQGGAAISADITVPLTTIGVGDPRVVALVPSQPLQPSQAYQFTVTGNITFGSDGNLDFNGRTPFSRFTTIAPAAPTSIELGNPSMGFPNKINRQNALSVILNVETPADTVAGDRVVGRIYGSDATTTATFDQGFVERSAVASAAGVQTVMLDFGAQLGNLSAPAFDDGDIVFAAKIERGNQATGFIHQAITDEPSFDITQPTLVQAGPPGTGTEIFTDSEYLSYYGIASEGLSDATLADGVSANASMFGSSGSGRFLVLPIPLGRLTTTRDYTVTLTDLSGNTSAMAVSGVIRQRGVVTGTLAGELIVEAYDHATLKPISGATVLVDAPTPAVDGSGQLVGTTDANGRVSFTAGLGSAHTITIVRAGYDLVTIYGTAAAHVSLPLSPLTGNTASLVGTATLTPTPGATVIVGSTALADHSPMGIRTADAAPTQIPSTAILPNRAQILTAFGGTFEAASLPTYAFQGCQVCGATLTAPTAPPEPAEPGGEVSPTIALLPAITPLSALVGAHTEDFGLAVGLDTSNLIGTPRARVTASLAGFEGQALVGIGTVSLASGTTYSVNANFSVPIIGGLIGFQPRTWLVTEAQDTAGRLSRVRVLLLVDSGTIVAGVGPFSIPTITTPTGAFSGSPSLTVADVLAPIPVVNGLAFLDLTARDSAGRSWRMIVPDSDVAGGSDAIQFPNLTTANVAGLTPGAWQMLAEARLVLSETLSTVDDFVLSERFRQEAYYSRSASVTFTVN
jgi:hypothetical protein